MDNIEDLIIRNARELKSRGTMRGNSVVREVGKEITGYNPNDYEATFMLTFDPDMAYISELKFKLAIGDPASSGGSTPPTVYPGNGRYKRLSDWLNAYPVGRRVDVDGVYGTQCVDYANQFWIEQTNRWVKCGGIGYAYEMWTVSREVNKGSEFELVYTWADVKRGDWLIFGTSFAVSGHVNMALESTNGDANKVIMCRGQNQEAGANFTVGLPISDNAFDGRSFIGGFRYKGWTID